MAIPRPGGTASTAAKLTGLAVRHTVAASRPPDRQIHVRALFHPCRWAPQRGLLNFAAVAIFLLPGPPCTAKPSKPFSITDFLPEFYESFQLLPDLKTR